MDTQHSISSQEGEREIPKRVCDLCYHKLTLIDITEKYWRFFRRKGVTNEVARRESNEGSSKQKNAIDSSGAIF